MRWLDHLKAASGRSCESTYPNLLIALGNTTGTLFGQLRVAAFSLFRKLIQAIPVFVKAPCHPNLLVISILNSLYKTSLRNSVQNSLARELQQLESAFD